MARKFTFTLTTDTGGDAAPVKQAVPGGGYLEWIEYRPGTIATGATVTVTDNYNGVAYTLWTLAAAGTSNLRVHPEVAKVLNTDGSSLAFYAKQWIVGELGVTISSGGASASGSLIVHVTEE